MASPPAPRVTVLMTLYNKGAFVAEAVRSVLASTFADFEVLVVDDASTDGGPERVRAIADPRVRLLASAVNTGRPAAANRGFEAARGEFVAVLDADDLMHPERLARQVAFLDAHPEVGAVGSSLAVFGAKAEEWHWPESDEEARGKMLFSDPACYGTTMLRRTVLVQHGLRCDEAWRSPGMDFLFLLSLAPYVRFANLREPLTRYRTGEQNMRHGSDPLEVRARIYRRQFELFGFSAGEAEVRLQLMLHRLFRQVPDTRDIKALAHWVARLKAMNRARRAFPAAVFEAELDRRFGRLFHPVADHRFAAGWACLRLSRSMSAARLAYLLKVTVRRWAGHRAPDPSTPVVKPAPKPRVQQAEYSNMPRAGLPRITIVTPSLQQAAFLEESIRSVQDQGYPFLEHMVVDGGSTDGSVDVIERHASALAWWCSEPDSGQSDALLKGAERATGDVFGWLNSDDLLLPGALAKVGVAFARDPSMQVLCGARVLRKSDGDVLLPAEDLAHPESLFTAPFINQQSTFYRMEAVRAVGFVERKLHYVMDYELWLQVLFRFGPAAVQTVNEPLSIFRQHPASKTSLVHHRFLDEMASVLHGLCASTGQTDLMEVLALGHAISPGLRAIPLADPAAERDRVRTMVIAFLLKWHHHIWTARDYRMMRRFRSTCRLDEAALDEKPRMQLAILDEQLRVPGWFAFRLRRKWQHLTR
jgi:glycosyltransferase involved in cell wall biosynthesis